MLVFFLIIVLTVILYLFIRHFSQKQTRENYRDLDFVNLSDMNGIKTDIIDDPMPQEIIITNSKYAFYKKEIKRTDFLKIIDTIREMERWLSGRKRRS